MPENSGSTFDSMRNIYNGYLKPDQKRTDVEGNKRIMIYLAYYFRQLDQDKMRRLFVLPLKTGQVPLVSLG